MTANDFTDEYIQGFFFFLKWADDYLLLAILLIIGDLFFGMKAARKRQENVRRSRALRRTMDKICSYILWIFLAYSFGHVFSSFIGVVSLPTYVIFLIYLIELESVYQNYLEWRGVKIKFNLIEYLKAKLPFIETTKKEENEKDK